MSADIKTAVIWHGIFNDIDYLGRFIRDVSIRGGELSSRLSLCMVPYCSLVMHESLRKLQEIDPTISAAFTDEAREVSARSRHSLKLFEDTKRGVEGQVAYFRDEIFSAHSSYFLGNTWLWLARRFETDLALFGYDDRLISTSHAVAFHYGFDPGTLLEDEAGAHIQSIFAEYGSYFASLGARIDMSGPDTFIKGASSSKLNKSQDVRSERIYRKVFNGRETPEINAVLMVFQSMLNFVDTVLPAGGDGRSVELTVFKIQYLVLYQVLHSVRALIDTPGYALTPTSTVIAKRIIESDFAKSILSRDTKPFRNMLMHYNLPHRINPDQVDFLKPFYGILPIYFSDVDEPTFVSLVHRNLSETSALFNEWSASQGWRAWPH
ncbi:hypothetical protein RB625_22770 [Streptomyces californicus]|uniref:hypothetical protein n=1 Tax=Streptomyces californicus TaxID=67351 RepID=UPI00296F5767|nr:hypothetical protein [Streptomyces californicus]MDW4901237.1 hypothetical protein [Streptomyces californicus]